MSLTLSDRVVLAQQFKLLTMWIQIVFRISRAHSVEQPAIISAKNSLSQSTFSQRLKTYFYVNKIRHRSTFLRFFRRPYNYHGFPTYLLTYISCLLNTVSKVATVWLEKCACYCYYSPNFFYTNYIGHVQTHCLFVFSVNSWPMWAVEASDCPPLVPVVRHVNSFRECTAAPVCDVVGPSPCWSASRTIAICHSQRYQLHETMILHPAYVSKQL